jgi:hypothetical protein
MPHRVTTFFRSHSNTPSDLAADLKKAARRASHSRPSPSDQSSTASSRASSILATDERKTSSKMLDSHAIKRISLPGVHSPKSSSKSLLLPPNATLDIVMESPPLVFYGSAAASSGALLSGQIKLQIIDDNLAIDSFKMRLAMEVTRKRPFHAHCQDCANQSTDLETWNFLPAPMTLRKGESMKSKPPQFFFSPGAN